MEQRDKYWIISCLFFIIITFFTFTAACQSGKGVTVEKNETANPVGNIYAIIIGISDYTHITPPLNYAHKDALIFYNYLVQHEKCNPNNIKLLINQEVNMGSIYDSVDSILTHIKPGDRLFFYFSGHGGVESSQSDDMAGMLFLTESPQNNFRRNKNFIYTLEDLKYLINSVNDKQATAIVIIDACHAGKFSFAGGKEGTNKILKTLQANWMNEIKFLACQEGEEAIENSNYGNGRGVFSYFFTEGLRLINPKKDDRITLFDLDDYVSKKVREATGQKQTPIPVGNRNFVVITKPKQKLLSPVSVLRNDITLSSFQEDNQNPIPKKKSGNNAKPLAHRTAANASETNFQKYQAALKENRFFKPENDCAYFHYKEFIKDSTHNKDTQRKMINELTKIIECKTDSLTNEFLDGKVGKITPQRVQNLLNDLELIQKEFKNKSSYESALYTKKYFLKSLMEDDTSAIKSLQTALDYDYYAPYVLRSLTERYALTKQEDLALKYLLRYVDVLPNDSCARVSLRIISMTLKSQETKIAPLALFSLGYESHKLTYAKNKYLGYNISADNLVDTVEVKSIDDFNYKHELVKEKYKQKIERSNRAEYEFFIEGIDRKFIKDYSISIISNENYCKRNGDKNRILFEFGKGYILIFRALGYKPKYFHLIPKLKDSDYFFKVQIILDVADSNSKIINTPNETVTKEIAIRFEKTNISKEIWPREVKILNVKPAFITFIPKPLTEITVDIEDDLTGYFSKLEVNDTTMVFRDKSEFSSYESKLKKPQKTPIDKSKFIVKNRNLLRTGLEVEVHFNEYRISNRNIIQYIVIKTKLSGSDSYEGIFEGIKGDIATIDGKSVRLKSGATIEGDKGFNGQNFTSFEQMMIGSIVKVSGQRQEDGTLMADQGKAWENAETKDDSKLKLTLQKTKKLTSVEVNFGDTKFNLLKNASLNDYVNRIGRSVVPAYQRELPKGHPVKIDFNFYIVEDSTFNACSYPDGSIFIHTALLTQMENEAQLATILSHEIAHVTYKHARLQMQKERVISSLTSFSQFTTKAEMSNSDLGLLVSAFGGPALSSKYSRDFEEQADRVGLTYMSQAGYDPREAAKIWKRLADRTELREANFGADVERAFEKGINSIYASHPDAQKRYKTLNRLIALNYYDQNFDKMKTNAKEYKQQMKALGRWLKMKGTTIYEPEPVSIYDYKNQPESKSSSKKIKISPIEIPTNFPKELSKPTKKKPKSELK